MKTKAITQEILLMTASSLARREWCETDASANKFASPLEQLQEACWNGLLDALLPGIIEKSPSGKKLFLWQIIPCNSFLEIDLCESPVPSESRLSVNPHFFLNTMPRN